MSTDVKSWKRTEEMTLPSGNVVELKRVSLLDLIAQGHIPDTLSALAVEVATSTSTPKLDGEQLKKYENMVNLVVKAAVVSPPVTDHGGQDSLAVRDIDWIDRIQIFHWANGAATALRPFRGQPAGEKKPFNAS